MKKRFRNFTLAIDNLFYGDDYLYKITDGEISRHLTGKYLGPWHDKKNMRNDFRNVCSDVKKAIEEGYVKVAAQ